jgi:MYXO-CTERM domain-containing protein
MSRKASALAIALTIALSVPAPAHAAWLFDFQWSSFASFFTLIPVDRVEPDGSVTPFDEVRIEGTRNGQGLLTLTQPAELAGGYFFEFSGAGASGSGQAEPEGLIPGRRFAFPLPPEVPLGGMSSPRIDEGRIDLAGPPGSPSGVSITYLATDSPHCMFDCSAIGFSGSGTRRTVSAPEPAALLFVAAGLGAALVRRRRRPRRDV